AARLQADFLARFAQRGCFGRRIPGGHPAAGETDLPGMILQVRGAAREEHRQPIVPIDDRHQHRGGLELARLGPHAFVPVHARRRRLRRREAPAQLVDAQFPEQRAVQGTSTTDPVVFLPSRSRWACCASASLYFFVVSIFTLPDLTMSKSALERSTRSARLAMCVASVGRVTKSEPLNARTPRFTGGTGPEALPKETTRPRGRRQSSVPSQVTLPTPSYTTGTPLLPVISLTRFTKSSLE